MMIVGLCQRGIAPPVDESEEGAAVFVGARVADAADALQLGKCPGPMGGQFYEDLVGEDAVGWEVGLPGQLPALAAQAIEEARVEEWVAG